MPQNGYGPKGMHYEGGNLLVRIGSGQDSVPVTLGGEVLAMTGATPVVTPAMGSGAIATTYAPGAAFWLESITCHFSAVPTTSEDFTITLNTKDGETYDAVLDRVDPSTITNGDDLLYKPDAGPLLCESGDAIDVAYTNTDGNTYGLRIVVRLA